MIRLRYIFIRAVLVLFIGWSCEAKNLKNPLGDITEQTDVENYTSESVSVKEFVDWCADEDHKLTKTKDISEMRYNLSYLPSEAMAFLELRTKEYDLAGFQKIKEKYSEMTYFNFKIKVINGSGELLKHQLSSPSQYEARVKYMSFQMEKDIYLVQGNDTIPPGLFHFERIFEVAPYATIMFAFDNKKFNKDDGFTIVYHDRLFQKGLVKFNYKNRQLINLPNISGL